MRQVPFEPTTSAIAGHRTRPTRRGRHGRGDESPSNPPAENLPVERAAPRERHAAAGAWASTPRRRTACRPAPTTSSARARATRSPARPPRRSAPSRSTRRRCPDGTLNGNVYLGQQLSRDPASGNEYRIFVDAESAALRALDPPARQRQRQSADRSVDRPGGRSPQVPFSSFRLTSTAAKGAADQPAHLWAEPDWLTQMTAWSGSPTAVPQVRGFTLTTAPGGGPCAKTLAERPFGPSFGTPRQQPQGRRLHAVRDRTSAATTATRS